MSKNWSWYLLLPQLKILMILNRKNEKPRASVQALGCRLNQYEGLTLEGKLRQAGYDVVPFGESADLGVINTCTVTMKRTKSRTAIRRFSRKNPIPLPLWSVVTLKYLQMK